MTGTRGDSDTPRLFAPGIGVLLGYVLLIGNPLVNPDIEIALTDSDSALRLVNVLVFYPSWQLDLNRVGAYVFWSSNLRTVLFVALAIAGLSRVSRWLRENTGGAGVFVATVGVIALSAVAAGLAAATIVLVLLDVPFLVSGSGDRVTEYLLGQLSGSASFGVLFGLMLGAAVIAQRLAPPGTARRAARPTGRRVNAPKSFW